MPLVLRTRQVGPWSMNTYALICPETGQSVLIDPGDDPEKLTEMLGDSQPVAILLTHTHGDHTGALVEMRHRLNVPVAAFAGPHLGDEPINEEIALHDGETFPVGNFNLRVFHAPGHIADQICFYLEDDRRVIVGDTIFDGGPGKTWSAADFQVTLATIRQVILAWPDDTICYPGHGPSFRLGDRRQVIENFINQDHGDFFGDATWDMA
jgi:hydroxyacylglutathione hydrolase